MKQELHDLHLTLEVMRKACGFVEGMDYEAFTQDDKTNFAAVRAIKVVSEAARRIPLSLTERYPTVHWRDMAGLYNNLVEDDLDVDLKGVWITVRERFAQVEPVLERILKELADEDEGG